MRKHAKAPWALIISLLALVLALVVAAGVIARYYTQPASAQPVAFSHRSHTPLVQCQSCHPGASEEVSARLPTVQSCMTCHQTTLVDSPEAAKLKLYAETGQEVLWVRRFALAADVRFSHKVHAARNVECATCHGDIAQEAGADRKGPRDERGVKLMDFCISCHRQADLSTDCLFCHE